MKTKAKCYCLLAGVLLVVTTMGLGGCKDNNPTTTTTQVTVTATRGDLTLEITAVGNLSYAVEKELSFDTGGTLAEVLVEVGDTVKQGQVLARLDLNEWQDNITNLESALENKKLALISQQQKVSSAERQVAQKERAVFTAQRTLENDQYQLKVLERNLAQTLLDIENEELKIKQMEFQYETQTGGQWIDENLAIARKQLELSKQKIEDVKRSIEKQKQTIADDEIAIEEAKQNVEDAKVNLTIEKANLEKVKKEVEDAQKLLDDAKATNPEIVAPFDGLITAINTPAGQQVAKGKAIVTIVDPTRFQAGIMVGETDITNVKINADATVILDAISNVTFKAKVSSIAPTATVSSGVVSYKVTVDIDSTPVSLITSGNAIPGSPPNFEGQSIPGGVQGQRPSLPEGFTPPANFTPGQGGFPQRNQSSQASVISGTSGIQLRQGMTATVNIIVQQAKNVVLIPSQAITQKGQIATVQVIKDGVITERQIRTGLTDSKYVEVVEGLSENEQVVYTKKISTGSTTTTAPNNMRQQQIIRQEMGGGPMPGPGGPP